ncbi:MAG TPA: TauD/TfdA family dioxygenase, partial [Dehalococcoidia bacterium]|nr:TauD/TfdA family dioxygenase [Dehalococcoidia bacterium]
VTNIPEARRKRILAALKEEDLPRNAYFGDGSPIDDWMLDDIRDAFAEEKAMFPWQKGDVVMVDNMLAAHAREPFSGDRMIWIGMAEAYTPES